ncbi:hypothetical protein NE857_21720 [Nocardiopsis exhalans]|uniref:Uncharacterized protein n=1 Tax=Nocardiopsis exhalans TaxID=163604 RepID=A0ABY5D412_9ACTN|nr:hypothetical protein [Nocardiopsis exhalans]USY17937.1 hypothetical protein NE857_21720 [Nocardiopsis exhalans]
MTDLLSWCGGSFGLVEGDERGRVGKEQGIDLGPRGRSKGKAGAHGPPLGAPAVEVGWVVPLGYARELVGHQAIRVVQRKRPGVRSVDAGLLLGGLRS